MSEETSGGGIPEGYGTVTPWLISRDSADLIHFLGAAFGAGEIAGSRMHNPDGSIAHVEVKIGSSIVMLFDSYEGWPKTPGFFRLYLEDADASYQQAMRAGATSVTEVTELFWGDRIGRVRDPFGNIWWLQSHATDVPDDQMQTRMADPGWSRRCGTCNKPSSTRYASRPNGATDSTRSPAPGRATARRR